MSGARADHTIVEHLAANGAGYRLALRQRFSPTRLRRERRPLCILPGYGMNAFIFGYHPTGPSMEEALCDAGFEVWSANLRHQGGSLREGGSPRHSLFDLGVVDLGAVLDFIVAHGQTHCEQVDAIGCSLGASLIYIHAVLVPGNRLGSIVSMGGPLAWEEVHPLLRAVTRVPALWGALPFSRTRGLARLAFPLLAKVPGLLSVYVHPDIVDMSRSDQLVQTVDDPSRHLNRELAEWVQRGDLVVGGVNVTQEFRRVRNPLLCVVANGDGIVPRGSVLSAHRRSGGSVNEVLEVGTAERPLAHADLFISKHAQELVFEPLAAWLAARA